MQKRLSGHVRIYYPKFKKEEIIERLRVGLKSLLENLPVKKVILFGSYAKGNYTVASDIDLLIIYEGTKRKEDYILSKKSLGIPNLEVHIYCEDEYKEMKQTIDKMTQDGIIIFP